MIEIVKNPWIPKPSITVQKYAPSLPTIMASDSISRIFATTKKNTPPGDNLFTIDKMETNRFGRISKIFREV